MVVTERGINILLLEMDHVVIERNHKWSKEVAGGAVDPVSSTTKSG